MVEDVNMEAEEVEKPRKGEQKQKGKRNYSKHTLIYTVGRVNAKNKAGLINHQRHKYSDTNQETLTCSHCGGQCKK